MTNKTNEIAASVLTPEVRTCPRCGLTETLLRTEGLLGCTTCYETFAELVVQAVAALHGVTLSPNNVPVDLTPETPQITTPIPRKTLSWLPRRAKAISPSSPDAVPTPGKNKRSGR